MRVERELAASTVAGSVGRGPSLTGSQIWNWTATGLLRPVTSTDWAIGFVAALRPSGTHPPEGWKRRMITNWGSPCVDQ